MVVFYSKNLICNAKFNQIKFSIFAVQVSVGKISIFDEI